MNNPGPGINPTHDLWQDGEEQWQDGEYFTEMITQRALAYIRAAARAGRPFFLYVPYNAPHYPMHAPQHYMDRFPDLAWDRRVMAAMLAAVDDSVGAILDEVERLGLAGDTCSFFMADNGPSRETRNWLDGTLDPYYGGSAGQLKGHKFSLYEGGIRVPGILHWPGAIPSGQVLDAPCAAMDIFPTFIEAAGGDLSACEVDGVNLLPYITGQSPPPPERAIFWEMNNQTAVRRGKWKLVLDGQLVEGALPADEIHLADLEADMAERHNLRDTHPDTAAELQAAADAWRRGIEARWKHEFSAEKQGTTTH
jgi:arylsulfatase A-like enzyme